MRPSQPDERFRCVGAAMLCLRGPGDHEVPELRRTKLRATPSVDLRHAWPRRGVRVALRELLLLGHDLENLWMDFRGDHSHHWAADLFVDGQALDYLP
jgi:hypothetical protein